MKKLVCILFSVYFISLAIIPCGDKDDCNEYKQVQTSQTDHKEQHSDEACTPFCVCSCCATLFLIKDFHPTITQVNSTNTVYRSHPEFKTSSAIIPIWQPPKLV